MDSPASAPLFIVGEPRFDTTLAAELLGRSPGKGKRNRGELNALPRLEQQLERANPDDSALPHQAALADQAQLLQDDGPTRSYNDKEPLNLSASA